uniref:Putative ATP/GTP-binding protein n=1 Tax=Klebsiella pneumoniae TaxID=573 RepID=A0A8B0SW38_KLEPN|nr:putative ATP/GTP-binding protein [Klebsiella pneumoniae]
MSTAGREKGAITGELSRTLKDRPGYPEQPRLVVLADPCGCASACCQ